MNKKEIINYFKKTKIDIQSANASVLACDLVYAAYVESKKVTGVDFDYVFAYINSKNQFPFNQLTDKKILIDLENKAYQDFLRDKNSLAAKMKRHREIGKEIDVIWKRYAGDRISLPASQRAAIFRELVKTIREWWYYGTIVENKGDIIASHLIPAFAKRHGYDLSKAMEIFNLLSHPKEQSVLSLERKRFLDICIYYLEQGKSEKFNNKVGKYIKDYFWFKTDYYGAVEMTPGFLLSEIKKEIKSSGKEKIKNEFINFDKNFKNLEKQREELKKNFKFLKQDKTDIFFSQQIIKWMDERKEGTMKGFYYIFILANDAAKERKKTYGEVAFYLIDEIEKFARTGETISREVLNKRTNGVLFCWETGGKLSYFYGKDAEEIFSIAGKTKTEEVKGQVASSGGFKVITGRAKLIFDPIKQKLDSGDILVTSMTRVEFVPLMRKAKAIVTNEGGIACHAAIISRELGLPCIIGTKNATRLLKNGDEIELDLQKGVIKIINKK